MKWEELLMTGYMDRASTALRPVVIEPPVREDGICAVDACGKKLQRPNAKTQYQNLARNLREDPFCSASCCREFYGVTLSSPERPQRWRQDPSFEVAA